MNPDNVNDGALDEEAKVFLSQICSEVEQSLRSPANVALYSKAYRGQDEDVREALAAGGNKLIALYGYRDARRWEMVKSLGGDAVCDHWRDGKDVDDNSLPKPLLLMRQAEKEENGKKAILLLAQAAAEGYPDAVYEIGLMLSDVDDSKGIELDYTEAFKWFSLLLPCQHRQALFALGVHYRKGEGVAKDVKEAFKMFSMSAELEYVDAQFNLALCYVNGEGIEKDDEKALYWYKLAADQGCSDAKYGLAVMYYHGEGIERDYKEAFRLFKLAADDGDAEAMNALGELYRDGEGVEQDHTETLKWFRLAADNGNVLAMYHLGRAFDDGFAGVNYAEAMRYYRMAAEAGDSQAMFNIAVMYRDGRGVPVNMPEAIKWFKRAAELDDSLACSALGFIFERGDGVEADAHTAAVYFERGADLGGTDCYGSAWNCFPDDSDKHRVAAKMIQQDVAVDDMIRHYNFQPHHLAAIRDDLDTVKQHVHRDIADLSSLLQWSMAIKPTSTSALSDPSSTTFKWPVTHHNGPLHWIIVQFAGLEVQGMMFEHCPQLAKFWVSEERSRQAAATWMMVVQREHSKVTCE